MDLNISKSFGDFALHFGIVRGALDRADIIEYLLKAGCSRSDLDLMMIAMDRIVPSFYVDMASLD